MDEGLSKAVLKVFVDLYNEGLIYKDKRLVNWDPEFQSAISDLEVEMIEVKGSFNWTAGDPDKPFDAKALGKVLDRNPSGHLYHFRYPLKDGATFRFRPRSTRTASRPRGRTATTSSSPPRGRRRCWATRRSPCIPRTSATRRWSARGRAAAGRARDPDRRRRVLRSREGLGRGEDHAGARLQRLSRSASGTTCRSSTFSMPRRSSTTRCRRSIAASIVSSRASRSSPISSALGLVEKIEPHAHAVPHAQRGNAVVEPWLTDQWYVNAAKLAKQAIAAVESGETKFVPKNWEKTYFEWMRNIEPWCISRQLWWGHQIPAWYGPEECVNSSARIIRGSKCIRIERSSSRLPKRKR